MRPFSLPDGTRLLLFANRRVNFQFFSIAPREARPEHLVCSRYAPAAFGRRSDLR
jgi:hypothetical protein